jgi:hypothetical protein
MSRDETVVPLAEIERRILTVRGQKVMLDSALAHLYGVPTKRLNEQVRRNLGRFPPDFMFQLIAEEVNVLRSQIATSKPGRGGRRYLPYAFTEHGAIMLASVLNTPIAVQASVQVVRAFVRLREMLATNKDLARKLHELEKKYDAQFKVVFDAIRQLMAPSQPRPKRIGFRVEEARLAYRTRRLRRAPSR